MSDDVVRTELAEGVLTITMDRPEARNAINKAMRDGLWAAFERVAEDDGVLVAILTGSGPVFSAGADLKEMAGRGTGVPGRGYLPHLGRNLHTDKTVIAAVNGPALAGGFMLAQMCDLCVAADTASFGISEAKWSRGAPWAAPLPWMIPPRVALELMVTALPISAARAHEIGLVNRVVPAADLLAEAAGLARTIAENAPLSVRAAKRMVYDSAERGWLDGLAAADEIWRPVYESEDAQEGPRAFREKRTPVWKGR
ncbi:MAG: enoyl-CoA hydratase/isomerase family protein [Acidimicrobiales bacterium]